MVQEKTMVVTDTLERVGIRELTQAYNLGFSDYQITLSMTEEKLQRTLTKDGFQAEFSLGLFDGPTLVGFVLNGVRGTCCYDSGTAIIPDYRGKGYAHMLVDNTLSLLAKKGIHTWVLEVLTENIKAINLYRSIGFTQKRKFNCYHSKAEMIRGENTRTTLQPQQVITIPRGECKPSWQNEEQSIKKGDIPTWDIISDMRNVGTLCYHPETGSIAQIYIQEEERNQGYAKQAIIEAAKLCKTQQLRFINVDDSYQPLNKLLLSLGFSCFTTQLEMANTLRDRA